MPYPIERKLVVAVASSALFDLSESDKVFRELGEEPYREYQREHQNETLASGVAYPFVKRLLSLNVAFPEKAPVEVVLLSKNDPDTGLRVFNSIEKYDLEIKRAAFLSGKPPHPYIPAFNASLFLSADARNVKEAVEAGHPAGQVLKGQVEDDPDDHELRVAFDFDGVLVDDEAETVYKESESLELYYDAERRKANVPHGPGPLRDLFRKLLFFQKLERKRQHDEPGYKRIVRTAIVTARDAPAHQRVVTTLRDWDVVPDETFFLGGIEKRRVLEVLKPHIFFDDQLTHLESKMLPMVHIPFGVRNEEIEYLKAQPRGGSSITSDQSTGQNA